VKVVKEITRTLGYGYEVFLDERKFKDVFIYRINKKYDGFQYMFLIDSSGAVIEDVFRYMNIDCRNENSNTREQALTALKLLYSFLEIKEKTLEMLDGIDIKNLSDFILGINVEGMMECWHLSTSRSITTHNMYFDVFRKYARAFGIQNKYLFEKITVSVENGGFGMLAHTRSIKVEKYKTNRSRHAVFDSYVPKYISLMEYKKIIKYIEESDSQYKCRNKLLINLMYTRGLRLGEGLGVSIEDIKVHPDDPSAGILKIRNRVSDMKYQHAKGCIKVISKNMYKTKVYNERNIGYQEVIIPPELMQQISEYKDESRDFLSLSDKKIMNIYNKSLADSVEDENQENYYLFLNKNGSTLSASGWNKTLKEIFEKVGIKLDKGFKRDNLSHRFRHGFAMYLIENEKMEITFVQKIMRHKSIQSTTRYYNPKPETILKETQIIQNKMKKILTEGEGKDSNENS
jgi:site-specific recombinase XerD